MNKNYTARNHWVGCTQKIIVLTFLFLVGGYSLFAQVTFEREIKISDEGLFFDGEDVSPDTPDRGPKYDFVFGARITPHGDCIKEYNGFVFMTWYRGGKNDRHVMLSRYNTRTGVTKTIEFGHQHNGFQNRPHLGESHNTIAIGICPIDGTIHMLYDMHAYSEDKPSDGSLANDYFRYTFSKKNAATVPDSQFNINQFVKDSDGDYKHLKMRNGTDYRSLTYPNFFVNKRGELFMWIREGGNNNGAYKFCKYDGDKWSDFTQFNVLNAKRSSQVDYNWGLYGDIKFSGGKMRIGFVRRMSINNDKYVYNNGFHYAYSDDPNGLAQWKDHKGRSLSLPIINPETIQFSEPGNLVPSAGPNTVTMNSGADWITTDNEDIHFVSRVKGSDNRWKQVHTYKKAAQDTFRTSTNFPGGNLYTFNNDVYIIGLDNGKVFVEKAPGGTNNWTRIYQQSGGKTFRFGNVYISDNGKLYFYLMERKTGSAQPIYIQILDLGLDLVDQNRAPTVTITSPNDGATFELGQEINLSANASDPDGNLDKVNFKINDSFYRSDSERPFETTFTPIELGTYKIAARAFDTENEQTEVFITINVVEPNNSPTVSLTSPSDNAIYEVGEEIPLTATASDVDGNLDRVNFFINDELYHSDLAAPYSRSFTPTQAGTYVIMARAIDTRNNRTDASVTITVIQPNRAPTGIITDPVANSLEEGYTELYIKVDANDPDGDDISVMLKIDGTELRLENVAPFEWGKPGTPNSAETIGLDLGDHVIEAIITDAKGASTTISKTITVDRITSTFSIEDRDELTVFPNPSNSGVFHFVDGLEWEIFKLDGKFVLSGSGEMIDISNKQKGVYFLKAQDKVYKLIVH